MKMDRMRHAHNNPKHIHYAQGLGNGNGNSQADDLPQVHVIPKNNGLNHEQNHQHQHPLNVDEFKRFHGIVDVDESIAAVAQPHEPILVPPRPPPPPSPSIIVSSPYETFAETKATELTLSTLIGLLVFLVPILVTLSLFVHRLATGTVPNPYHIPSTTTHGGNTRRSIPRTDSSIRTARIKKEDGWSQDEEVEDGGGGASISSSSTGGDSCSMSSTCMRQQPVDYGTALDGREDVISLTNNQGRSSSLSATKNSYWGESGARLRKTQSTKASGVVVGGGGGGGGGGGDYQMYSSRSSSPDRTSMLFTTSSMEDSPVARRATMRHSNLTGGTTATTTKGTTSTIAAITPSTTREEDPELDIGLGLDGFGMYNRSISIDSDSDECINNNNSREMHQHQQQQQLRMRRTSNRNPISTSASSSAASSPIVPPHQPQHLNLNQDSFEKKESPKAFQLSSTSYSSSSWNEQTPTTTSTSHTPLSTNKKSIQSSHKSSTSTRKERNLASDPSDSPPFLPPFSPQVVVPNKSNSTTDAERNLPPPPPPPILLVPPPLSRLSPKARRQKTEELLPRLAKSTHDIQMGDGTDYYSSDVSGGGEDDGTSSSIASVYSVEPSNPLNDDMYLSTPLMSNMKEEVGMDLTGKDDRMKQMVSIPSLEGNVDDDKDKVSPGHIKNESIEPIAQIESKTTCSSSTNWMDVNALASPRSISVDELKLQKMESGLISPESLEYRAEWRTAIKPTNGLEAVNEVDPILDDVNKAQGEEGGNQDDRHDTGELSTGETEGANGILHKRKDLTACSDAASSLRSSIAYKELKMKKLIGGGGFGQVHEATWRGTPVAVKVLAASSQAENVQKAILQEFAAEINMVSGMRHPNICLYIGACLEHPNRCIVTELAANGSLWDALRQTLKPPYQSSDGLSRNGWPSSLYKVSSPQKTSSETATFFAPLPDNYAWPWILVRRVAAGAARGMNYLHCGHPAVLHRDLKSANILLDDSYNAKVCDFGLSRLKAQERSMTGNCGTVQWMAPEILANQHYAEPADVYSYGIILWELLSRECPYEGMSPIQCALAVLNQNLRPKIPEWCPPAFGVLIKNCIDKDPNARPTFENILCILDSM